MNMTAGLRFGSWIRVLAGIGGGVALAAMASCAGATYHSKDPVADIKNKDLQLNQREIALDELWQDTKDGKTEPGVTRETLKDLIWKGGAPAPLRQKALALLLSDTTPEAIADTRHLLLLRLPTEGSWPMVVDICEAIQKRAADPAWRDQTASLVRSYARKVPIPPDPDRPERGALMALYPDRTLDQIVLDVFIDPRANGAPERPDDSASKASASAWDLLARLDPDGSKRTELIAARGTVDPALAPIARAAKELGVVPVTGAELTWVKRLLDDKDARSAAWWAEASAAVQRLTPSQRQGLQLRHIEPVRWAAAHRTEWLSAEREDLYNQLQSRLSGRVIHRKFDSGEPVSGKMASKETAKEWKDSLVYGDLLAIMVIDEAVHQPGVMGEFFKQATEDRADTSTEYGGVLWATDMYLQPKTQEAFLVRGYQPRPTQRVNDRTFIAPEEMFVDSGRSLAHYHFHVQTDNNAEYAGPGKGDLEYAATNGRSCVVLTSVRAGVMDVDYYQRGGVIVDLGEIVAGR